GSARICLWLAARLEAGLGSGQLGTGATTNIGLRRSTTECFAAWRSPTTGSVSTRRKVTGRRRTRWNEGCTAASGCVRSRGRSEWMVGQTKAGAVRFRRRRRRR
uniref:Uncharacterized protein n=1 Tax=Cucumis melo TaxID=3656 RepID=A0A9I9CCY0_CUCME